MHVYVVFLYYTVFWALVSTLIIHVTRHLGEHHHHSYVQLSRSNLISSHDLYICTCIYVFLLHISYIHLYVYITFNVLRIHRLGFFINSSYQAAIHSSYTIIRSLKIYCIYRYHSVLYINTSLMSL